MRLIGLNGLKTSGKDTIYDIIARDFTRPGAEGRVERRAFADKLKIMAALALGFDRPEDELIALMDEAKEKWNFEILDGRTAEGYLQTSVPYAFHALTGREYLQNFGNHARRVFGDTFWVDQVLPLNGWEPIWNTVGRNIEGARDVGVLPHIGVITDVRYPNEAERVREFGEVIEVIRPGLKSDGHVTEKPLPRGLVDGEIVNGGSLEDLALEVGAMIRGEGDWAWEELESEIVDA